MKFPVCHANQSGGFWSTCRECLYLGVSSTLLVLLWREVKETRILLEESLQDQQRTQEALRQECRSILTTLEQIDRKLNPDYESLARTEQQSATSKRKPKTTTSYATGSAQKNTSGSRRKSSSGTSVAADAQPQSRAERGAGEGAGA